MAKIAKFELIYPPSVNRLYRVFNGRSILSAAGRKYKDYAVSMLRESKAREYDNFVEVLIEMYPPDKRIRDTDNILKITLDSLADAKILHNDYQIKKHCVERLDPVKNGMLIIYLRELNLPYRRKK